MIHFNENSLNRHPPILFSLGHIQIFIATAFSSHLCTPTIHRTKCKPFVATSTATSSSILKIRASASLPKLPAAASSIFHSPERVLRANTERQSLRPVPIPALAILHRGIFVIRMQLKIYLVNGKKLELDVPGTWTLEMLINHLAEKLSVEASRIRLARSGQVLTKHTNQLQIQFKASQTQSPIICNVMAVDPSSFGASESETKPLSETDQQRQALADCGIPKEETAHLLEKAKGEPAISMRRASNPVVFDAAKEKDIRELMAFAKMERDEVIAAYVAHSEKLEETKQYLRELRGH